MTDDELFQPTLRQTARDPSLPAPWRIGSQLYVAFFGGCFAALVIAWLNVHRLGGDWRTEAPRLVGLTTLAWGLASTVAIALLSVQGLEGETARYVRWSYRLCAVLLHFGLAHIQAPLDRRFAVTHEESDYASLWLPGLAAVGVGGAVQFGATLGLLRMWTVLEAP